MPMQTVKLKVKFIVITLDRWNYKSTEGKVSEYIELRI